MFEIIKRTSLSENMIAVLSDSLEAYKRTFDEYRW